MSKIPNYDKEFKKKIKKNLDEVVSLLEKKEKGMLQKIMTFSTNFGFNTKNVKEKIKKYKIVRAHFAKDPGKQNIYQNLAGVYIKNIKGVKGFVCLGNNDKVVSSGAVMSRREFRALGGVDEAKTIDFEWNYNGKHFYVSHKYTKSERGGGMQGNQYKDVQLFIRQAGPSRLSDTYFLAICDGDFYNGKDTISNTSRMQRLKDMANNRNVFAMRLNDLELWMKSKFRK